MTQPDDTPPKPEITQPLCETCGIAMMLIMVEPVGSAEERHVFECGCCQETVSRLVAS
jgi:hypothetical protein